MWKIPVVWVSGFVLGVSLFTPTSSFNLGIDYYEAEFPGQQLAVKITICYEVAFILMQLLCHFGDSKLPVSRAARIELRHLAVAVLLVVIIVWDRVLVGPVQGDPPAYAVGILLSVVTLAGCFDGMAIGAMFGEMAILGPEAAHALVAGTAGVMPLLAVLRIIFKAALPETEAGLRLSLVCYFATAVAVLLLGLAVYMFLIQPAVAAVTVGNVAGTGLEGELGIVTLVPTISLRSRSGSHHRSQHLLTPIAENGRAGLGKIQVDTVSPISPEHSLRLEYSLPNSIRGSSLLVRRVHTHLPPELTRTGSMAGYGNLRCSSHHLASWSSGRLQQQPTPLRSITIGCDHTRAGENAAQGGAESMAMAASKDIHVQCALEDNKDAAPAEDCLQGIPSCHTQNKTGLAGVQSHPDPQHDVGPLSECQQSYTRESHASEAHGDVKHAQQLVRSKSLAIGSQLLKQASIMGVASALLEDAIMQANMLTATQEPKYFVPGYSVWKSNWLAFKGNVFYVLGTILTYACNYGIYPGFISFIAASQVLRSWYSLVLVTAYGFGDLIGKLLPLWRPQRPQATTLSIAITRLLVFFPLYVVALYYQAGPYVMVPATFLLSFSGWYEAMIFSLACEGQHPVDAYQVESMLAIQLDVGIALGSVLSLSWAAGPWAI